MTDAGRGAAAVALSTEREPSRAAIEVGRELTERLGGPADWAVAFATSHHREGASRIGGLLSGALGTPYVAGSSASGVIAGDREIEEGPALAVLAVRSTAIRATPFLFEPERGDPAAAAASRLAERMGSSRASDDLLLVWPDPYHVRPDQLLHGLDAALQGVTIAGGASSVARPEQPTFQLAGERACERGLGGMRLGGALRREFLVTQGCRPLSRPLRVTGAHEHLVLELEGRPALEVVREQLPAALAARSDWSVGHVCVGLLPDERHEAFVVRNIVRVDRGAGLIAIGEPVLEGMYLVVAQREGQAARDDLRRRLEPLAALHRARPFRCGIYFNCMARGRALHGEPGVDAGLIARRLPDLPLIGFFSAAEIGPFGGANQLFTYTGVLVLIGDGMG